MSDGVTVAVGGVTMALSVLPAMAVLAETNELALSFVTFVLVIVLGMMIMVVGEVTTNE